MNVINRFPKKIFFKHTGRPGEFPQAAWAFWAAQVTTSGGLKRDGKRQTPLNRFFQQPA